MRTIKCLIAFGSLFAQAGPSLGAVVRLEIPELTAKAQRIVVGDVAEVIGFRDPTDGAIRTRVVIERCEYLVGEATGTEVLEIPGGTVGDLTLRISVVPVFERGDHVLLFLKSTEGAMRLVGGFQGAYLTDGLVAARMAPGSHRIIGDSLRPLEDVRRMIQSGLPPGTSFSAPTPYEGTFRLPLVQTASDDCHDLTDEQGQRHDWTYKLNPMGEVYVVRANCADSTCGSAISQTQQIKNGAEAWEKACADFHFSYEGTSESCILNRTYPDGTNCIHFEQADLFEPSTLAETWCWWFESSPRNVIECDMAFNDQDVTWWNGSGACPSGAHDIWSVAAHEFGHFLMLFDLYDWSCRDQTMYGYGDTCDTHGRDIAPGDIKGILAIYGSRCGDGECEQACNENPCTCPGDCRGCCDDDDCDDGQCCNGDERCIGGQCLPGTPVICNDNVGCTRDRCDEHLCTCVFTPDNALCSDGVYCNGAEKCQPPSGCQPGMPPNCDDAMSCTIDSCDQEDDVCVHTPDDEACDNQLFCDGDEICDVALGCQDGPAPCPPPLECDENRDLCVDCSNDSQCDDGLFCNGVEGCVENICQAGAPPCPDDGVACTVDCDEQSNSCVTIPDHSLCDDGLHCNGFEYCDPETGCQAGTAPDCDDRIDCTADACDEQNDKCTHSANDAACDDGFYCNGVEVCDPSSGCTDGPDPNCADGVACTVDTCEEDDDACVHTPNAFFCDDGQYCNGRETCDVASDCQPGSPIACDDSISCTADHCDEQVDRCVHVTNDSRCSNGLFCDGHEYCDPEAGCRAGTAPDCNDRIDCTTDACDEQNDGCTHSPNDAACDDGFYCNGVEICDPSSGCTDGPDASCADGVACTVDACDEVQDTCMHAPDSALCADGNVCTDDSCDASFGCVHTNNTKSCNDGNACTTNDACSGGTCAGGPPLSCDDANICTQDSCNPVAGCSHVNRTISCDDGNACTTNDTCASGTCLGGPPPDCDDGNVCTSDSCDPDTGCAHVSNRMPCDDGNVCTMNDVCSEGTCVGGVAVSCDDRMFCNGVEWCDPSRGCQPGVPPDCGDGIACTVDACDESAGGCLNLPDNDACDDGVFCNGAETCDSMRGCQPGTAPDCDDENAATGDMCDKRTDRCKHVTLVIDGAPSVRLGEPEPYACYLLSSDDGSTEDASGRAEWQVVDAANANVASGCAAVRRDGLLTARDHCVGMEINVEARVQEEGVELVARMLVSIADSNGEQEPPRCIGGSLEVSPRDGTAGDVVGGATVQFVAIRALPGDADRKDVTYSARWMSDCGDVESGIFTAPSVCAPTPCRVTAIYEDGNDSCSGFADVTVIADLRSQRMCGAGCGCSPGAPVVGLIFLGLLGLRSNAVRRIKY